MLYKSTRGGLEKLKFEEVLFSGFLPDGGLAIPEEIPAMTKDVLNEWAKLTYKEIVEEVMHIYISEEEISKSKLKEIVTLAYRKFDLPEVIQTRCLRENLFVAELFHGPTLSFKDLALSVIGQLLEHFSQKRKKHINVVVATSGDTGSAAIESVRGLKWVDIVVLYPKGRCTPLQKLQMTTVCDDNVTCIAIERSSDELDILMRECFADENFSKSHNLCSINSINWARIMVQIAHYFYLYLKISPEVEKEITFVVPTGAAGNITAGFIAKSMGLPIKLVSTVNRNDVLYRALKSGNMVQKEVVQTHAVAMDIQLRSKWQVETFDDDIILRTIKTCWDKYHYLICPHTATAIAYCILKSQEVLQSTTFHICLSTASPKKFPEAASAAEVPCDLFLKEKLLKLESNYIQTRPDDDISLLLRNIIERNTIQKEKVRNE